MDLTNYLAGFTILICDDSITVLRIMSTYLQKAGSTILTAMNGEEGLEVCSKNKVDLIISDINMPIMDGFKFFDELNIKDYNIPRILITDANIDEYINLVIDHNVGNILSKPIEMRELVIVCHKLITGEKIFGLKNYIIASRIYKSTIYNSRQIHLVIENIISFAQKRKLDKSKANFLSIILDEVLSNAVYHAHGFTMEKELKKEITLPDNDQVEVCYCINEKQLGISVTDFKGVLTKQIILNSFKGVIEEKKLIEQAFQSGEDVTDAIADRGRGLQMIRLMANEYYFNIRLKHKTQVIILVDLAARDSSDHNSSIKINEIY